MLSYPNESVSESVSESAENSADNDLRKALINSLTPSLKVKTLAKNIATNGSGAFLGINIQVSQRSDETYSIISYFTNGEKVETDGILELENVITYLENFMHSLLLDYL